MERGDYKRGNEVEREKKGRAQTEKVDKEQVLHVLEILKTTNKLSESTYSLVRDRGDHIAKQCTREKMKGLKPDSSLYISRTQNSRRISRVKILFPCLSTEIDT